MRHHPSPTNNTANMWSHQRNHHVETFTSLQRHGVLPNEITVITASPTKPAMAIRPKFSLQAKDQADGLATEWLLDSHGSLTACEHQRHRDYVSFLSGGAYKPPSHYAVKLKAHHHVCNGWTEDKFRIRIRASKG